MTWTRSTILFQFPLLPLPGNMNQRDKAPMAHVYFVGKNGAKELRRATGIKRNESVPLVNGCQPHARENITNRARGVWRSDYDAVRMVNAACYSPAASSLLYLPTMIGSRARRYRQAGCPHLSLIDMRTDQRQRVSSRRGELSLSAYHLLNNWLFRSDHNT